MLMSMSLVYVRTVHLTKQYSVGKSKFLAVIKKRAIKI